MNKTESDRGISSCLFWLLHVAVCAPVELHVYIHQCPHTCLNYEKESTDKTKQTEKGNSRKESKETIHSDSITYNSVKELRVSKYVNPINTGRCSIHLLKENSCRLSKSHLHTGKELRLKIMHFKNIGNNMVEKCIQNNHNKKGRVSKQS